MSASQKLAWFNLIVVAASLIAVSALTPVMGLKAAQGGFGILGLLGFGPLFYRKKPGVVVGDERDALINARSWLIAYAAFWLVFVAVCVAATPFYFGSTGAVPVVLVQVSVWYGLVIVVGVASLATLIQYRWGGPDAA
jgi:hypothetical protein